MAVQTELQKSQETRYKRALNKLISLAGQQGFSISWIESGEGQCLYWENKIEVGNYLSLVDKIVVLAHELGHVVDWKRSFPDVDELVMMVDFWKHYSLSREYYKREKEAWNHAQVILKNIDVWHEVRSNYNSWKSESLGLYFKRHMEAKEDGLDIPPKEEFLSSRIKITK